MTDHRKSPIAPRKQPLQARSAGLVDAVLEAAIRVLSTEGAQRFTTARVAEKAGISVGSLYQYFPNKAAILFRLQSDEWGRTLALLRDILEDGRDLPAMRLRRLVHAFVRSECEEAVLRGALDDAAPLYRDAPEAREAEAAGRRIVVTFMKEALPNLPDTSRALACGLITETFSAVGKRFSEVSRTEAEMAEFADALADMLCAYLDTLERVGPPRPRRVFARMQDVV